MSTWSFRRPPLSDIKELPVSMSVFREWRMFFRMVESAEPGHGVLVDVPMDRVHRERMSIYRYAKRLRFKVTTRESDGKLYVISGRRESNQNRRKTPQFAYSVEKLRSPRKEGRLSTTTND